MPDANVILAGATGNLGGRIARSLRARGAAVRALVRRGAAAAKVEPLRALGADVVEVDFGSFATLRDACAGGTCVVSALAGLRPVIVDAQTVLLDAAVDAGVKRFVPSDFSIDFTRLAAGSNRNLDLRRDFHVRLASRKIAATSIYNGAFAELLTGQAPLVLFKLRRVLYWGDADVRMDFTTVDDTAAYTALVALDPDTPRALHIAGDQLSARELASVATEVTGTRFGLLRAGPLPLLAGLIRVMRTVAPGGDALYPPWQGMQYMHNMFSGRARPDRLDNDRYPGLRWTTARDALAAR